MLKLSWLIVSYSMMFVLVVADGWSYGAASSQQLVPASFQQKTDKLGFVWDIQSNGRIQYGTNRVFNGCGYLQVNGNGFSTSSSNERKMSRDGSEYFLTRNVAGLNVTRRIKIDTKSSTVRYVEIFQNPTTSPITLTVTLGTSLRVPPQAAITDKGKPAQLASPAGTPIIAQDESGIVAYRSPSAPTPYGTQPSVLFFLAGRGGRVRPSRNSSGNQQSYVFLYRLVVPPQKQAAVIHGVAQRHFKSQPNSAELARQFRDFRSSSWTRDLPAEIRKSIVNMGASSSSEQPSVKLLQATTDLAQAWSVETTEKDVLVFDEETRVSGTLAGKSVSVTTQFGDATIPIGDVAAIVGAGGEGRPTRVHLRNGEILVGPLRFEALRFNSDADLQFELQPERLNVLFTRTEKNSAPKEPDVDALLKTRRGDRLAVSGLADLNLSLVTAFGPHTVSLEDVRSAAVAVSPQPVYRLVLNSGSKLSAMIRSGQLSVDTSRFGKQPIDASMIASFIQLGDTAAQKLPKTVAEFKLAGGNLLVGKPVAAQMTVVTAAGEIPVTSSQIRSMNRLDPSSNISPVFEFEMADGSKFEGRPVGSLLGIESPLRQWQVQVAHIISFVQPDLNVAMARRLAEEFESLEAEAVAQRLKEIADEKEISVAAMTLVEMGKERSAVILEAAKKLDAKFAETLSESIERAKPDEDSTDSETNQDNPPAPKPTSVPTPAPHDPFGSSPSGFGGADPFAERSNPFGSPY